MNDFTKIVKSQLLVGFISFVLFWEIIDLVIPTHTIPSPIETLAYLFTVLDDYRSPFDWKYSKGDSFA